MIDRMQVSSETLSGGVQVVKAEGILDTFTFAEFKDYLSRICGQGGNTHVIVDLSEVPYISSSGWSVLLSRRVALRHTGGDLSIFGLGIGPRRIYESMRIQEMLPAAESAEEAIGLLH